MVRSLNSTMVTASNWRSSVYVPPISPILFKDSQCNEFANISWDSYDQQADYQLYGSDSSDFENPILLYSGKLDKMKLKINHKSKYLRVNACNNAGCSPDSNQILNLDSQYCNE